MAGDLDNALSLYNKVYNLDPENAKEEEILFSDFDEYIYDKNLEGKPIQAWREFIKNCKFDCWDCNKCDNLYEAKNGKPQITIKNIIVESICGAYTD